MSRARWSRTDHRVATLLLILTLGGCSGRSAGTTQGDGGTADAAGDAGQIFDAATHLDGAVVADAGSGCECSGNDVYRWHECVPTLELGCGPTCEPGVTDCGEYHNCDPCGASSTCDTEDCRPTCVHTGPAMGPVSDPLANRDVFSRVSTAAPHTVMPAVRISSQKSGHS